MVTVVLPHPLRTLAGAGAEVQLEVAPPVTAAGVLDALEARFPMLCGTVRDHDSGARRAYVRYYVCGEDWSHEPAEAPLPQAVAEGREPFLIIGAIAGGAIRARSSAGRARACGCGRRRAPRAQPTRGYG